MSRRSGSVFGFAGLALVAVLTAACSSSGPRPTASVEREAAPVASADTATPGTIVPPIEVPERASAAFARALGAMAAQDWLAAELELGQLTDEYPAFPGPFVNLAIVYRREGRLEDAAAALRSALEIAPDHAAANGELGVLLRERGDFAEAEAAYRRAIASDAGYALAHFNLGVLLDLYMQRGAEALEHYEAFQSLVAVPDPEVERWIVDLRRRLGMSAATEQLALEGGT